MSAKAYGDDLGSCFGLNYAPALITRALRKTSVAATEIRCDTPLRGLTKVIPAEDAFFIAFQIRAYPRHEIRMDGKPVATGPFAAGETSIYDLRDEPVADLHHPSHAIFFYVPRAAFSVAGDSSKQLASLRYQKGAGLDDPVIRHLSMSLLPAFSAPERASTLFVDHVTMALASHVAHTYGEVVPAARPPRGGLAGWQEKRAKEMLSANLDGEISLVELANECSLSLGHFTRAFRISVGMPPHRFLLQRRIDKAKCLLSDRSIPLSEIAQACGFADQSHFTATFTKHTGLSPGAWRRSRAS